jgi:hypothetical protein
MMIRAIGRTREMNREVRVRILELRDAAFPFVLPAQAGFSGIYQYYMIST